MSVLKESLIKILEQNDVVILCDLSHNIICNGVLCRKCPFSTTENKQQLIKELKMIKFYEFPSTDTLIVLDTEKQLAASFPLKPIKSRYPDFTTWWGDRDISQYITRDFEGVLDSLKAYYA